MRTITKLLFLAACVPALFACGGGGGSSAPAETGQVTVLVGDHRALGWDHVWITFSEVRFITQGGQDIHVLDEPLELDLLALENYTERLVPAREIVTGTIHKVRFIISDVRLERVDPNDPNIVIESLSPKMRSGKIDLILKRTEVRAGEKLVLEVDFDLRHCIHFARDGWSFRPVIRAKSSTEPLSPRLMRVEGDVDGLVDGKTRVCDIRSVADDGVPRPHQKDICILVETDSDTQFFKAVDDGSDVLVQSGDHVLAYGTIDLAAEEDTLVADVLAIGDGFVRMKGEAMSMVADGAFELDVNKEEGVDPIAKQVALVDGARVFDSEPKEVTPGSIAVGNYLETEGFDPMMGGDPDLNAFIVLLNHEVMVVAGEPVPTTEVELEQVTGEIQLYGAGWVTVLTDAGVDDCVMYGVDTEITDIDSSGTETVVTQVDAPPMGTGPRTIDARGLREGQCLNASTIVVE